MLQSAYLRLVAFMLVVAIMLLMVLAFFGYVKVLIDLASTIFMALSGG